MVYRPCYILVLIYDAVAFSGSCQWPLQLNSPSSSRSAASGAPLLHSAMPRQSPKTPALAHLSSAGDPSTNHSVHTEPAIVSAPRSPSSVTPRYNLFLLPINRTKLLLLYTNYEDSFFTSQLSAPTSLVVRLSSLSHIDFFPFSFTLHPSHSHCTFKIVTMSYPESHYLSPIWKDGLFSK